MKAVFTALLLLSAITLCGVSGFGCSDSLSFDTLNPMVELISPWGADFYLWGSSLNIQWSAEDQNLQSDNISVQFSRDGGFSFVDIQDSLSNTGLYVWQTPLETIEDAKIKVLAWDSFGNMGYSQSLESFIIGPMIPCAPQNVQLNPINSVDLQVTWEPVALGTFGQGLQPQGYLVFYSESSPVDEDTFFLLGDVTDGCSIVHLKTLEHWDKMFYRIYAYLSLASWQKDLLVVSKTTNRLKLSSLFRRAKP